MSFDPQAYGPAFALLLDVDRRRPLGAGSPCKGDRATIERLSAKTAFAHLQPATVDRDLAACCVSGVWLMHDYLDESHEVSQGINTAEASFWHGIMHRREGDFSNAKYWFRHIGDHPVYEALTNRANALADEHDAASVVAKITARDTWEPYAFVDLCQAAERGGGHRELCLDLQQAEWELLFDFCFQSALGR